MVDFFCEAWICGISNFGIPELSNTVMSELGHVVIPELGDVGISELSDVEIGDWVFTIKYREVFGEFSFDTVAKSHVIIIVRLCWIVGQKIKNGRMVLGLSRFTARDCIMG